MTNAYWLIDKFNQTFFLSLFVLSDFNDSEDAISGKGHHSDLKERLKASLQETKAKSVQHH